MRGRYLALEGIEGAGKSTVARRLVEMLTGSGRRALHVREPGGTPVGERVRDILLDPFAQLSDWTEALLFSAARAQLARDVVAPTLESGTWVVSDRSVYSSLAYQGGGRGLGIEAVRAINEPGLEGVWPELVVLLEIDPETGLERQEIPDRIGAEGLQFQADVATAFRELAAAEDDRFLVVDASVPAEQVAATIYEDLGSRW